jgi:hypothetical protein
MVETGGPGDRGRNIAIALVQLTVRHVAVMVQGGESAAPRRLAALPAHALF